jgi:hypothetical protein
MKKTTFWLEIQFKKCEKKGQKTLNSYLFIAIECVCLCFIYYFFYEGITPKYIRTRFIKGKKKTKGKQNEWLLFFFFQKTQTKGKMAKKKRKTVLISHSIYQPTYLL